MGAQQPLKAALAANRESLIRLTQDLVRFPSTIGQERPAQEYYGQKLSQLGATVDMWEPDVTILKDHPSFTTDREDFSGSPVVVGVVKGTGGGRSLMLGGHMDVVPAGEGQWTYPPFSGQLVAGKIYGRGSCDMKAGLAANYIAMKSVLDAGIKLKGDVILQSSIDEEGGCNGALAMAVKGYRADGGIMAEPTGMQLFLASVAGIFFRVKVEGKSAHGGLNYNGVNSLYKAMLLIDRIRELEEIRRRKLPNPLYNDYPIPFCVGVNAIQAGGWPGIVPAETVFEGRICAAPNETVEEVKAELEAHIAMVAKSDPWLLEHPPVVEYYHSRWNSGSVAAEDPFTLALKESYEAVCSSSPVLSGMAASSDSGTFIRYTATPMINFGPGDLHMAHQTDEYVEVEKLCQAAEVIAQTIVNWCGVVE